MNVCASYFQLKLMTVRSIPAATAGSASTSVTDPVPPLLIPQHSTSFTASAVLDDPKEEVLAGSVDQFTPASSKKSNKEGMEEILNFLKTGNKDTQKTLALIDSWCLWMEVYVTENHLSLSRSF